MLGLNEPGAEIWHTTPTANERPGITRRVDLKERIGRDDSRRCRAELGVSQTMPMSGTGEENKRIGKRKEEGKKRGIRGEGKI